MSKKPLSGKRWFEAMGRRARSQGKAMWLGQDREQWPLWAKHAYMAGYIDQWCSGIKAADHEYPFKNLFIHPFNNQLTRCF